MSRQDLVAAYVRSHGFAPTIADDGAISFAIPYVNIVDGTEGVEVVTVRSLVEAREALGY